MELRKVAKQDEAVRLPSEAAEGTVEGLSQVEDRFRNTTDVTDDGVITSLGADLAWERAGSRR